MQGQMLSTGRRRGKVRLERPTRLFKKKSSLRSLRSRPSARRFAPRPRTYRPPQQLTTFCWSLRTLPHSSLRSSQYFSYYYSPRLQSPQAFIPSPPLWIPRKHGLQCVHNSPHKRTPHIAHRIPRPQTSVRTILHDTRKSLGSPRAPCRPAILWKETTPNLPISLCFPEQLMEVLLGRRRL